MAGKTANKFTNEDLKRMQSWSLEQKISVSLTRIAEFYNKFPNKIYVSFSGGKDSTVLLHLVRRLYPNTPAVFVDTGLEYPEIREFVKTIDNVIWLKPKMNFKKVIKTYGYPVISKRIAGYVASAKNNPDCIRAKYLKGEIENTMFGGNGKWGFLVDAPFKISEYCCTKMKKEPNKKFAKDSGLKPIFGTMTNESVNRKQNWLHSGCNIFDGKEPKSQPISFWTEQDILEYIKRYLQEPIDLLWEQTKNSHGSIRKKARKKLKEIDYQKYAYASVYGNILEDKKGKYYTTGCKRTGCVFCMFGCHLEKEPNRFQMLKETHPKLYEYCMKPLEEGGLGIKEVIDWINENGNLSNHIKY